MKKLKMAVKITKAEKKTRYDQRVCKLIDECGIESASEHQTRFTWSLYHPHGKEYYVEEKHQSPCWENWEWVLVESHPFACGIYICLINYLIKSHVVFSLFMFLMSYKWFQLPKSCVSKNTSSLIGKRWSLFCNDCVFDMWNLCVWYRP